MNYIDIETVSAYKNYAEADERTQELFKTKFFREIETIINKGIGIDEDNQSTITMIQKAFLKLSSIVKQMFDL